MPVQVQTTKQVSPLRRAFGLFGGLRLKLDETVVPVAIVEDLVQDEWRDAFMGDGRNAGGAANRNIWQLSNPAGSGKVIELYEVSFISGSGCVWSLTVTATPYIPGTVLGGQWQDLDGLYLVPSTAPSGQMRHTAAAAALTGAVIFTTSTLSTSGTVFYHPRVLLKPGQVINLWQDTLNVNGYVALQWRERALQSTE